MNASTNKPLRIAIATLGRFHVLDLARELDALGHHVQFYSYVPKQRALKFGLPAECHVALLPWLAPVLLLARFVRLLGFADASDSMIHHAADRLVAWKLRPCDVFIGMSGIYLTSFKAARQRYGAKLVLERGSTHIQAQREILDRVQLLNPAAKSVNDASVHRETLGYQLADRIVVPSLHVEDSFTDRGFNTDKLFRNPYGVNIAAFAADPNISRNHQLIIFVGIWCFRKGVDTLVNAMHELSKQGFILHHIGAVGDALLPDEEWFRSTGPIDQAALPALYQRAHCLVLPSREDGLALVQLQATACGCPVIGSTMSGARDLQELLGCPRMVQVVPVDRPQAIVDAVQAIPAGDYSAGLNPTQRESLSWRAYGQRYDTMLQALAPRPTGIQEARS